jgi:DnaK suppressor protein
MDGRHARELLARERARVEHGLTELQSGGLPDRSETADVSEELVEEELDQAHAERLHTELEAIERAERRLAEDRYGISIESGEPIPDARLEAIPWAERTAPEQTRYESSGG